MSEVNQTESIINAVRETLTASSISTHIQWPDDSNQAHEHMEGFALAFISIKFDMIVSSSMITHVELAVCV